jgi:hypothetical protein
MAASGVSAHNPDMAEGYRTRPQDLRKFIAETDIKIDRGFAASAAIFGSAFTVSVALGLNFALGWALSLRVAGAVGLALGFAIYKLVSIMRKSNAPRP